MTLFGDFTTNVPVAFQKMRALIGELEGMQEGVVGATDLKVSQRGAGPTMSVDVAVGAAFVQVDTGTRNGLSHIFNDAIANVVIAAAHATLPRLDQVVAQYNDSSIPAGVGGDTPTLRVIQGTPTSGATLDNRTGAAALPNDCARISDVIVPAAAASIVNANIRDRRPWARGAYRRILRSTNEVGGADYTTASGTFVTVDDTNLAPRIECSGAPLRIRLRAKSITVVMTPWIDGVAPDGASTSVSSLANLSTSEGTMAFDWDTVPTAGSHVIKMAYRTSSATATLRAAAANPVLVTIEEIVRPNADNT